MAFLLKPHKPVLHYYFFFPHFTALHLSILSPKMSEDKESHNISPVNERADSGSGEPEIGGVNSDDISGTSPVVKKKIKEHDDKDDKNVAGLSGVKIGDLCSSATSPTGAKNEVREDEVGEHSGSINKNVAGPTDVMNTASEDETYVDIINLDEDQNNGLTDRDILIAQIEAEKYKRASSSSSNDAESSGKNKNEPTSKRQRLD